MSVKTIATDDEEDVIAITFARRFLAYRGKLLVTDHSIECGPYTIEYYELDDAVMVPVRVGECNTRLHVDNLLRFSNFSVSHSVIGGVPTHARSFLVESIAV